MRSAPARLAVAHRSLDPIRLADAMHTVDLLAGLAARHHAGLHLGLGEVLELVVDVQVLDAAVETGAVLQLPETENPRVHIHWHACRGRERRETDVYTWEDVHTGPQTDSEQRAGMSVMEEGIFKHTGPTSADAACQTIFAF